MRRDLNLIRFVLFRIEEEGRLTRLNHFETDKAELEEKWGYNTACKHCTLLHEDGYITKTSPHAPYELTLKGHDLADSIRDDILWADMGFALMDLGGSVPLEIVQELAKEELKFRLGLKNKIAKE